MSGSPEPQHPNAGRRWSLAVGPACDSDADTMAAIYVAAARQAWAHIYGDAIWGRSARVLTPDSIT